jgi:tetratricopeptide (TPR) repeat protein
MMNKDQEELQNADYESIEKLMASDESPVGIDAKKTHILILQKLINLEKRLERLEAEQSAELGVSMPGRAGWAGAWRDRAEDAGSGLASVIWPELRRSLEEVNWLQAAALRMLPGEGQGPADREEAEREAAEILGRYFVSREEYDRAVEVLSPAVDAGSGADEDRLDALYLKGLAHLRMDEDERAEEYFRRVADRDEVFRSVAGWFAPGLAEETAA